MGHKPSNYNLGRLHRLRVKERSLNNGLIMNEAVNKSASVSICVNIIVTQQRLGICILQPYEQDAKKYENGVFATFGSIIWHPERRFACTCSETEREKRGLIVKRAYTQSFCLPCTCLALI